MHSLQSPPYVLYNLALATIPVVLGFLLAGWFKQRRVMRRGLAAFFWVLIFVPLCLVWLAFLPNTCYLLTEWRHFFTDSPLVQLRDTAVTPRQQLEVAKLGFFFLLYSGDGILCYALAIRPVASVLRQARLQPGFFAVPFFLIISLGVYLGLVVRLNSWEIVSHPKAVWFSIVHVFHSPALLKVILVFAILLWILYEIVDAWLDGMLLRFRRRSSGSDSLKLGKG
jgi:uncharacterized membrane protein